MMYLKVFVFVVCIIFQGIAQDVPACRTKKTCDCCKSNPHDGTRKRWDICENQAIGWKCSYGCIDGYSGWSCESKCPHYCTRCARYFYSRSSQHDQKCYLCADGYYNGTGITNCSTPCPANCAANQCDKTTGNCLLGCSGNWIGDKCNICADTWYGNTCKIQCPFACKDKMCDVNGDCMFGCSDEWFTGSKCDQCLTGKYGDKCDKRCLDYCKDRICDSNGECSMGCADDNFTGSKCNQCVAGKYGDYCEKTCSVHCKDDKCNRLDGQCTDGCTGHYYGDICDKCQPCYYGTNCDKWCYSCLNGMCDQTTGRCIDCDKGKFDEQCDKPCSTDCLDGGCSRKDGACTSCRMGYYGKTCNKTCPYNCLNNVCGQYDGICHNCSVGYYSRSCDYKCPNVCINDACDQESGDCTFGGENGCQIENICNNELQTSSYAGVIVGGVTAGLIFGIILTSVLCFIWRRRQTKENKKDPEMHVNVMYENDKADPDGYEELHIPNH